MVIYTGCSQNSISKQQRNQNFDVFQSIRKHSSTKLFKTWTFKKIYINLLTPEYPRACRYAPAGNTGALDTPVPTIYPFFNALLLRSLTNFYTVFIYVYILASMTLYSCVH